MPKDTERSKGPNGAVGLQGLCAGRGAVCGRGLCLVFSSLWRAEKAENTEQ